MSATDVRVSRLVWDTRLVDLVELIRQEAETARAIVGDISEANLLERTADRFEAELEQAAAPIWIPLMDAARSMSVDPPTLRARCRRRLEDQGLARKESGEWVVHVSVVSGAPAREE